MDGNQFDGLIKGLSRDRLGRRNALKVVVVGALGIAVGRAAVDDADAKKKKGKKKRCKKDFSTCPTDESKCCTKACCLPITGQDGDSFCRPKNDVCCSEETGGGACPETAPQCCGIGPRQRFGLCITAEASCCSIESGGGWCDAGETCCLDSVTNEPSCCLGEGGPAAKSRSAAVRPRHRASTAKRRS